MTVFFDASFYLLQNPDVAAAVARGETTAEGHFQAFGQFENRAPSPFFDPLSYLQANPDVAAAVASGGFQSAFQHFQAFGAAEDREPSLFFNAKFYLASNPDVAAAVAAGDISAFEHFSNFGVNETRDVTPFFDIQGYLAANPDVLAAVQAGSTTAIDHFTQFGFAEGRQLGNGLSLSQFANDPTAQAAIAAGDFEALFSRVAEIAPFIKSFTPPTGYEIPLNQPIPQDFVQVGTDYLVVPAGVGAPNALPSAFGPVPEQPGAEQPGGGQPGGGQPQPINHAPVIDGGDEASFTFTEGSSTPVATIVATDIDPNTTLHHSISGGPDAALFKIDSVTGVLSFIAEPDFADPKDVGGNNVYELVVKVSDGGLSDTQKVKITVEDAPAIELVAGIDNETGTAFSDRYEAVAAGSLNGGDTIAGGAGYDVLTISAGAIEADFIAPTITGVERINTADVRPATWDSALRLNKNGANLDLANVEDLKELWATFDDAANGAAALYRNASSDTIFGASGAKAGQNSNLDITFSGDPLDVKTVKVALADNEAGSNVGLGFDGNRSTTPLRIETVSIDVEEGNAGQITVGARFSLKSIEVTGEGDVIVRHTGTGLTKLDASSSSGDVSYTSAALVGASTVQGGSGNDLFDLRLATVGARIDGGAGKDTLYGSAHADVFVFAAGDGNDIVRNFAFAQGDRLDLQGQVVSSTTANVDGYTVLTLSGGGTITLSGVLAADFDPGFIV